jgi:hypothetical protein
MLQATFERMNHPVPETLAYYKLGVLHQELGNPQESGRYLQAFLDRWGTADWDLGEVADARRRLAELQARAPEADRGGRLTRLHIASWVDVSGPARGHALPILDPQCAGSIE